MDKESMEMFQKILDRLDNVDSRFDKVDGRLDKVDSRLDKVDSRLDIIEFKQNRTDKKLDDFRLDVAVAERDIRRDICELKDEMETVIEILRMNEMVPR